MQAIVALGEFERFHVNGALLVKSLFYKDNI